MCKGFVYNELEAKGLYGLNRSLTIQPEYQRNYIYAKMDADHVTAWSKGGSTSLENCEMLCSFHNRSKGNK